MMGQYGKRAMALLARLRRNQRGNMLLLAAAGMPVVIGASGLGLDGAQWFLWKRQLQQTADSGALAGAFTLAQSAEASQIAAVVTNDFTKNDDVSLYGTPVINSPPTSGPYAGNNKAVQVQLQTRTSLPFSGLFLDSPPVIGASAVAALVANGTHCVISLESGTDPGIQVGGSANVQLGCGMATNSRSATDAFKFNGNSASLTASPLTAVGGIPTSGPYGTGTELQPYSVPQQDPLAGLPTPVVPNGSCPTKTVNSNGNTTLTPGCYKDLKLQKGNITLQPGVYYIDGGSLDFGAQANVSGTGVTFVLTSKTPHVPSSFPSLSMNGGAVINLVAPTSGTYAGILFYMDRRAPTQTITINGNSSSRFEGTFYMPSQALKWNGSSGMDTKCTQIVSRNVEFTGNTSIQNECPAGSGAHAFTGTAVRLVG